MRRLVLILASMLAAGPAASPSLAKEKKEETVKAQTVALEAVALPIVVDGKLINYVFCSIRLDLNPNIEGARVRAKEQYFRDDLVRAGHRTPFVRQDDYSRVDEAKVRAELLRFAAAAVGPGVLRTAVITKQTSQKLMALPPAPKVRSAEIIP